MLCRLGTVTSFSRFQPIRANAEVEHDLELLLGESVAAQLFSLRNMQQSSCYEV